MWPVCSASAPAGCRERYPQGRLELIQVCADLTTREARDREVRALLEASSEHPRATLHLVGLDVATAFRHRDASDLLAAEGGVAAPACDVIVDEEFRRLVPPLTEEERLGLEENLLRDGCLDPLVVWTEHRVLLDGHNRQEICDRYGIDYMVRELSLPDRDAAADWIDAHQPGRRNLTPAQTSLMRGWRYNRAKGQHGGDRRIAGSSGQSVHLDKTAEANAKQHGVNVPRPAPRTYAPGHAVSKAPKAPFGHPSGTFDTPCPGPYENFGQQNKLCLMTRLFPRPSKKVIAWKYLAGR